MKYFFLILLCFTAVPAFAYNSGFTPVYQPNGGGSANLGSIHDIGNVTEIGCAVGQILEVNTTGFWACANDDTGAGGGNATLLNDLGDVNTVPVFGEVLYWNGAAWVEHLLILQQDIYDVSITLAERGDFLWYDGTNWIDKIFSINSITCAAGDFVNVINNQTGQTACGTPTGSGFNNISSESTSVNATIVSDNSTVANRAVFKTISAGSGIQVDNGSQSIIISTDAFFTLAKTNDANTTSILADNSTIPGRATFKSLSPGTGITLTNNDNDIVISSTSSGGGTTSLANNVTTRTLNSWTTVFTIPMTSSSGNSVSGVMIAASNAAANGVQFTSNFTNSNHRGTCSWVSPLTSTTVDLDILNASGRTALDPGTGTSASLWAWNTTTYTFDCAIYSSGTGSLNLSVKNEVAGNINITAGSYYIKTP